MPAPLIHIGFQKTGTTFLQANVFNNIQKGFGSNWTVRSGEAIEHFVLAHPRRFDPAQIRAEFDAAHATLPDDVVKVLSHEDLSGHPIFARYYGFDTARRIHEVFPDGKVLIGIREQRSMLRSLYGQYIRQDGEWPIESFLGQGELPAGFQTICRLDHFEYHLLVDHYVELFGRQNVLVLPIEMLRHDPLAYEQAIHDFAGTSATAGEQHQQINVGSGAMTLAFMRAINKIVKKPPDWNGNHADLPLITRAKWHLIHYTDKCIPKSWHKKYDQRLRDFIARRVGNFFAASNQIMAERFQLPLADLGYDVGPAETAGSEPVAHTLSENPETKLR